MPANSLAAAWRKILRDLYDGTAAERPFASAIETGRVLAEGFTRTFMPQIAWDTPDNGMMAYITENLHAFGGAKTAQQMQALSALLTDASGTLRTFSAFRDEAMKTLQTYNRTWLETEYNQAVITGQAARGWQDIQESRDLYPFLTYRTAGDGAVRPAHAAMNGITLAVDDPFWGMYYPPNGWGCRCYTEQTSREDARKQGLADSRKAMRLGVGAVSSDMFRNNPGLSKKVFNEHHPYFIDTAGPAPISGQQYGLRPVDRLYMNEDRLPKLPTGGQSADQWLQAQHKAAGEIVFATPNGLAVRITDKAAQQTDPKLLQFMKVLTLAPDEVFFNAATNRIKMITFVQGGPVILEIKGGPKGFEITAIRQVSQAVAEKNRLGTLTHVDRNYQKKYYDL